MALQLQSGAGATNRFCQFGRGNRVIQGPRTIGDQKGDSRHTARRHRFRVPQVAWPGRSAAGPPGLVPGPVPGPPSPFADGSKSGAYGIVAFGNGRVVHFTRPLPILRRFARQRPNLHARCTGDSQGARNRARADATHGDREIQRKRSGSLEDGLEVSCRVLCRQQRHFVTGPQYGLPPHLDQAPTSGHNAHPRLVGDRQVLHPAAVGDRS